MHSDIYCVMDVSAQRVSPTTMLPRGAAPERSFVESVNYGLDHKGILQLVAEALSSSIPVDWLIT